MDRHLATAQTTLCIASRDKNRCHVVYLLLPTSDVVFSLSLMLSNHTKNSQAKQSRSVSCPTTGVCRKPHATLQTVNSLLLSQHFAFLSNNNIIRFSFYNGCFPEKTLIKSYCDCYNTMRYNTIGEFNVDTKAECDQLNQPTQSEQQSPAVADKPARRESMPKLLQSDVLTTLSLTILAYLHSFSCCCVRNLGNPEKFTENSNLWSSRSSKVIDLGVIGKPICDFILVINSSFSRICYRFRDIHG